MKVNKDTADKIWIAYFGYSDIAIDAFGFEIHRDHHGDYNSIFGWDVDHIWPKNPSDTNANPGSNTYNNVQPLLIANNYEKSDKLQGFVLEDDNETKLPFTISKIQKLDGKVVGRMKVNLGEGWEWAYEEPEY